MLPYIVRQTENRWAALVLLVEDRPSHVVLFPAYLPGALADLKLALAQVEANADLPGALRNAGYPVIGYNVANIGSLIGSPAPAGRGVECVAG